MAFWGIEVKPGKPYTHSSKDGRGRLRISQATLATGSAIKKSLVQCNVGDKSPVLLCALLPDKTESLQLDLEFDEAEDVIFSVIGPRGVYLTGYYVGQSRHSIMQDDTESFGEDIANSETQESNHCSDEDEYEDSFINDDEPEPLTPSPVSSTRDDDDDDDEYLKKKKRDVKGGRKRLIKKSQVIESDDEMELIETDDEDFFPISSIRKINKSETPENKIEKETTNELEKETKNNDDKDVDPEVIDSKDDVNVQLVNGETEGKGDEHNEVVPESKSKSKSKKKKSGSSKEKKDTVLDAVNEINDLERDIIKQNEENTNNLDDKSTLEAVANEGSVEVPVSELKTKKKKKEKKKNAVKSDDENHIDDVLVIKDNEKPNDMGDGKDTVLDAVNEINDLEKDIIKQNEENTNNLDDKSALEALANEGSVEVPVNELKTKKKKKEKKKNAVKSDDENHIDDVLVIKDNEKPNNMGDGNSVEVLASDEVVMSEDNMKPMKKRKTHGELYNKATENKEGGDCKELANGNNSEEKKIKKKKRKTSKTSDKVEENTNKEVEKGNKNEKMEEESNKKTLSNGLVIEELVKGNNLKRKIAAPGKKVKVEYVVKLKEKGQVIDSNGESPYKFRLGDKHVIEGLNVGIEGMKVGDKRRLTIPPSMSLGYKGTGENIPPNSWLIFDVEMCSIH